MNLQTAILESKRIMIPLIGLIGYVVFQTTGVKVPEDTILDALTKVISSGEVVASSVIVLWNVITKVIDKSREESGHFHLSWWNVVGIFKELMKVINIFKKS